MLELRVHLRRKGENVTVGLRKVKLLGGGNVLEDECARHSKGCANGQVLPEILRPIGVAVVMEGLPRRVVGVEVEPGRVHVQVKILRHGRDDSAECR